MQKPYKVDKITKVRIKKLLRWETNQRIVHLTGAPLEYVRKQRAKYKKHSHRDVDDLELGNQKW